MILAILLKLSLSFIIKLKMFNFTKQISKMLSLYEVDEEKAEKLEDKIKNEIEIMTLPYLFEDFLSREDKVINNIAYYDLWAYALYTKEHQEWILNHLNEVPSESVGKFKGMMKFLYEDLQKGYEYGDFSNLEDDENPYKIIQGFQSQLNNIKSL